MQNLNSKHHTLELSVGGPGGPGEITEVSLRQYMNGTYVVVSELMRQKGYSFYPTGALTVHAEKTTYREALDVYKPLTNDYR